MSSALGNLVVNLALETAQFTAGIDKASYTSQRFAENLERNLNRSIGLAKEGIKGFALGALGAVGAVVSVSAAMTKLNDTFARMDELSKRSQKFGIPVEQLSALEYTAEMSGVAVESLGSSLRNLSKNAIEAVSGSREAQSSFKALGVEVTDSNGKVKDSTALLDEVAEKFAGMSDGAAKTAISLKIFGKSGADLIPLLNGGAESIKQMQEEAQRLGLVMSTDAARSAEAFNDNVERLKKNVDGLFVSIATQSLPALVSFTDKMNDALKASNGLAEAYAIYINEFSVLNMFDTPAERIAELNKELADTKDKLEKISKTNLKGTIFEWWEKASLGIQERSLAYNQAQMNRAIEELVRPPNTGASADQRNRNKQDDAERKSKALTDRLKEEADAQRLASQAAAEKKRIDQELLQLKKSLVEATNEFIRTQEQEYSSQIQSLKSIQDQVTATREHAAALNRTDDETRRLEQSNYDFAISVLELKKRMAETGFESAKLAETYDAQIAAIRQLQAAKGDLYFSQDQKKIADEAKQAAEDVSKEFLNLRQDVARSITDAIADGSLKGRDALQRLFKTTAIRVAIEPFVTGGVASLFGLFGLAGNANASAGYAADLKQSAASKEASKYLSDPVGAIKGGVDAFTGGLSAAGNTLANYAVIGSAKFGELIGASDAFTGALASVTSSVASALPYVGAAFAIDSFLFGGKITGSITKALGLSGGGGPKQEGGYYAGGSGFTGNGVFNEQAKAIAQNTVDQYNQITAALGGQAKKLAVSLFIGSDPSGSAATQLAFSGSVGNQSVYDRSTFGRGYENVGRSEEALKKEVEDVALRTVVGALQATNISASIDKLFDSVDLVKASFDELNAVIRQANILRQVNLNIGIFAENVRKLTASTSGVFSSLVDAAGGADAFGEALNQYVNLFATDGEKLRASQQALDAQFQALNVSTPATVEELRKLIDAQDLTTDSGLKTYLALIGLSESFKQVTSAAKAQKDAVDQTRDRVQGYLDVLNGTVASTLQAVSTQIQFTVTELSKTTDVQQRIALEGQLSDLIFQRYQAEIDMLGEVLAKTQDVFASISQARTDVASARSSVSGQGPLIMTAAQIRAGIAEASSLGALPAGTSLNAANAAVSSLNAQSSAQKALIESLTGQQGGLSSAMSSAQIGLENQYQLARKAAELFNQNNRYGSAYATNQSGGLTTARFDEAAKKVMADYAWITYNVGREGDVSGLRNQINGTARSELGGTTIENALFGANGRIAEAQKQLTDVAAQLTAKTLELSQAQAKSTEIQAALKAAEDDRVKAQEQFAKDIQQYVIDAGKAVDRLSRLREETVKYYEAQDALAKLMQTSANGLRTTVAGIRYNDLNPIQQLASLQGQFSAAYASAQVSSGQSLSGFGDQINSLIGPLLEKATEVYASGPEFQRIKDLVLQQAEAVASRLESLAPQNYQQESLALLDTIDTSLALIEANTASAEKLIVDAIDRSKESTLTGLRNVVAAIQGTTVQAFATGGVFTNSVVQRPTAFARNVMGEAGPEAVMPLVNLNGALGVRAVGQAGVNTRGIEERLDLIARDTAAQVRVLSAGMQQQAKQIERLIDENKELRKKLLTQAAS